MQALQLIGDVSKAWPLIQEGHPFEDNGGEPDGDAWLSVAFDQADADRLITAGLGRLVEVKLASHEAMARYCGFAWGSDGEFEDWREEQDWVRDTLFPAMADHTAAWCYYSVDKRFLFIEREREA